MWSQCRIHLTETPHCNAGWQRQFNTLRGVRDAPEEMHSVLLLSFAHLVRLISSRYVITKTQWRKTVSAQKLCERTVLCLLVLCFSISWKLNLVFDACGRSAPSHRHPSCFVVTYADLHCFCIQLNYSCISSVVSGMRDAAISCCWVIGHISQ